MIPKPLSIKKREADCRHSRFTPSEP